MSSYLAFDDSIKVGNKLIDQEHEVLIKYINLLHNAVENEDTDRIVAQVLDGLAEYTKTHFFVEEELMKAYTYPDLESHKKAHEKFRARLGELQWARKGSGRQVSEEILEFLKQWLTNHILKIDRKLSEFLKDKSMSSL